MKGNSIRDSDASFLRGLPMKPSMDVGGSWREKRNKEKKPEKKEGEKKDMQHTHAGTQRDSQGL